MQLIPPPLANPANDILVVVVVAVVPFTQENRSDLSTQYPPLTVLIQHLMRSMSVVTGYLILKKRYTKNGPEGSATR